MTAEHDRLSEAREQTAPWKKWGPYLSERQWGTVREDYSENGDAWNYFTHDHARCRAYRWGEDGRRPVFGDAHKFRDDPHWRDCLLFYEYFHGDNGAGLGASHQTGWTGVVARTLHLFGSTTAEQVLSLGKAAGITEIDPRTG
jgi:hypothetical protein